MCEAAEAQADAWRFDHSDAAVRSCAACAHHLVDIGPRDGIGRLRTPHDRDGGPPRRPLLRLGRPEHADHPCTDRRSQVARPGVVGHQQRRALQQSAVRPELHAFERTHARVVLAQQAFLAGTGACDHRSPAGHECASERREVRPRLVELFERAAGKRADHDEARLDAMLTQQRVGVFDIGCRESQADRFRCRLFDAQQTAGQLPVADQCMAAVGDGFAAREQKAACLLRVAHRTQAGQPHLERTGERGGQHERVFARIEARVRRSCAACRRARSCATRWRHAAGRAWVGQPWPASSAGAQPLPTSCNW